ncbi:hypothetical protein Zmor_000519 [Zophobas morio]|uniref:NADH dehydrogenase [ubiquinone] 1 alpha subcomplex subunit 4 n=1 Tax=Zophobas morio TaxID=2755281 RepID=A0AA38J680_9CUCU|nr:hypothetical protein Zmor_000519 [Zophobas morio]
MARSFWRRIRKHLGLFPLYLLVAGGTTGAVAYGVRTALQNPDVQWNRRNPAISNEEYRAKQYKFYSPTLDYSELESPAPLYQEL